MTTNLAKPHPPSLSPRAVAIAGAAALAVAAALFAALAWQISTEGSPVLAVDERLSAWMEAHAHPVLTAFFFAVTHANSVAAIGVWSVLFGAVLARLREWYWIVTLSLAVAGAMLLNLVLKAAFERLRPRFEIPLVVLDTYSFPSGHTAAAVAFYGVLAAFLVSRFYDRRRRAACVAGAIAAVGLVAASRVYLGAHYLSDVIAAMCSSTVWLVLCLIGGHAVVRGRLRRAWLIAGPIVLVALGAAVVLPLEDWSKSFMAAIDRMDLFTGLIVFSVVHIVATLLLLPIWIFSVAAGAVFGFAWGLAAALLSAVAAALVAFLLSRYVLRRPVERAARRNAAFKAMDESVAKEGWRVVALLRMSPLMPSGIKSYFLGLTRIRLPDYLLGSAAGMLPAIFLKVYVGAVGRDALTHGGPLNWTMLALGVAATLGVGVLLSRRARRKLVPS